jgi:hypothetical protein
MHEAQQLLRGTGTPVATARPMRYSFTYEVQLHLIGTATPTRYDVTLAESERNRLILL